MEYWKYPLLGVLKVLVLGVLGVPVLGALEVLAARCDVIVPAALCRCARPSHPYWDGRSNRAARPGRSTVYRIWISDGVIGE